MDGDYRGDEEISETFHQLLVPLDGSPSAEAALPAAHRLSLSLDANVTLLHMIESRAPQRVHGQIHLASVEQAEGYLKGIARNFLPDVRSVHIHVHTPTIRDVAQSIVDHSGELGSDLIVLCAHGAGGIRHGLFGTVAQRVIARGTTPVLLVTSTAERAAKCFSCHRMLVPLDGRADHEQGLVALGRLWGAGSQQIRLLMVIAGWMELNQEHAITSRLLPGTTVELLNATRATARAYLSQKVAGLHHACRHGAEVKVTAQLVRGDVFREIVRAAEAFQANLIVLGTDQPPHSNGLWWGSITPQLVQLSRWPLLLVPPVSQPDPVDRTS